MNIGCVKSLSVRIGFVTLVTAMSLVPTNSLAQAGNTATGDHALFSNTTGTQNTADGYFALFSNTAGLGNTAAGYQALHSNTTGNNNTANGVAALYNNTTGFGNTAIGVSALQSNSAGNDNTAIGVSSLQSNTTGVNNTANGYFALFSNTTGGNNAANGTGALQFNTTGQNNTANGSFSLFNNTTGSNNIGNGYQSLYSNTTGSLNIANGSYSLYANKTGNYNTATGLFALYLNQTGNSNIGIGYGAGQNIQGGSNNIAIGNVGTNADNGIIRIGTTGTQQAAFIAGVNGVQASGGVPVYINSNGQLGTLTSSARFKFDIHDLGTTSDKLMNLRPVTFRYKEAASDGSHPLQYGLIAEEVAKVYPDMVQYDKEGKPFTVFYQQLTPMMLNELQKAHRQAEAQKQEIADLMTRQQKQSEEIETLRSEMAELKQAVGKQGALAQPGSHSTSLVATILAACLAGALFFTVRTRSSR